jgi:hypothetical protein
MTMWSIEYAMNEMPAAVETQTFHILYIRRVDF